MVLLIAFWVAVSLVMIWQMVAWLNCLMTRTTRSPARWALLITSASSWLFQPVQFASEVLKLPSAFTFSPKYATVPSSA